jgi:zinc protease
MKRFSVAKKRLDNGLTILVLPNRDIPKVSLQLWYQVGSKNENEGTRGIAHLIEHMIFKGTEKLSESDINALTYKLSSTCNAFTSHDYTGYLFDVPAQNWQQILPVMADCMRNCTFKQEFLNSELKAVIQELRMYNDDYFSALVEKMLASIFADHPYHYPVIGYKHDLWNLSQENLRAFYEHFYTPDNATLVVVGDVEAEEVFASAQEAFGAIPAANRKIQHQWPHTRDIAAHSVTLYRDVQQPVMVFVWEAPGVKDRREYQLDLLSWILGAGRGAHLYNLLVTELGLATEVQSLVYDLFDRGAFLLYIQPACLECADQIRTIVMREIEKYRTTLVTDAELHRAQRKTEMDLVSLVENNQKLAYLIGKLYTATGDENYLETYAQETDDLALKQSILDICKDFLVPSLMHTGFVLPFNQADQKLWQEQQELSEAADAKILGTITRDAPVEEARYTGQVIAGKPQPFTYPKAQRHVLANGLKLFLHPKKAQAGVRAGKIDLLLDLKAKHYYDSPDHQGLSMMVADLLQEGTKTHTSTQLALELEGYGMELNTFPGQIGMSMLGGDAQKGLGLLCDVLTQSTMEPEPLERVRQQMLAELKLFWDTPADFVGQLARQLVYGAHPYAQNMMGDLDSVGSFTREQVLETYRAVISPDGGRLAIVGDFDPDQLIPLLEKTLGAWQGPQVRDMQFPALEPVTPQSVNYPINRDQVVLAYGGLSVARLDPDFDALLLFDQVFTGGVLGGMNSRLFELRERTGLFYTVSGSLLAGVGQQPGMVFVKTIVSGDRLQEAEKALEGVISAGAVSFTLDELEEARRALVNSMVDGFASGRQTAATFVTLDRYGLPDDYFDKRPEQLYALSLERIKDTVARRLDLKKMLKIRVGRV